MHIFYINLADAVERRTFLQSNIQQFNRRNWPVTRVEAVQKNSLPADDRFSRSKLSAGAIACFLSHMKLIELTLHIDDDILVLEDDAQLGAHSHLAIEQTVNNVPREIWDIMFTDICVPSSQSMVYFFELRKSLEGQVRLLDLAAIPFCGSTAYVLNRARKHKFLSLLKENAQIDLPYDLFLRKLTYEKRLLSHVIFPFPTSISKYADETGIQSSESIVTDVLWNAFRRLVWFDSNVSEAEETLQRIHASYFSDREAQVLGTIMSGLLNKNYKEK